MLDLNFSSPAVIHGRSNKDETDRNVSFRIKKKEDDRDPPSLLGETSQFELQFRSDSPDAIKTTPRKSEMTP